MGCNLSDTVNQQYYNCKSNGCLYLPECEDITGYKLNKNQCGSSNIDTSFSSSPRFYDPNIMATDYSCNNGTIMAAAEPLRCLFNPNNSTTENLPIANCIGPLNVLPNSDNTTSCLYDVNTLPQHYGDSATSDDNTAKLSPKNAAIGISVGLVVLFIAKKTANWLFDDELDETDNCCWGGGGFDGNLRQPLADNDNIVTNTRGMYSAIGPRARETFIYQRDRNEVVRVVQL